MKELLGFVKAGFLEAIIDIVVEIDRRKCRKMTGIFPREDWGSYAHGGQLLSRRLWETSRSLTFSILILLAKIIYLI